MNNIRSFVLSLISAIFIILQGLLTYLIGLEKILALLSITIGIMIFISALMLLSSDKKTRILGYTLILDLSIIALFIGTFSRFLESLSLLIIGSASGILVSIFYLFSIIYVEEKISAPLVREIKPLPIIAELKINSESIPIKGYDVIIGREDFKNVINKEKLKYISRKHLRFFVINKTLYVEDLNSTNGTLLNNVEIKGKGAFKLKNDDILILGKVIETRVKIFL